jgi:heterodisulfide reductase subunit D
MEKLLRTFGEERVLTDIEDLYVYSFHGEFCIRRRPTPSAVLRLHSESEVKDLMRLAEAEGVRVVRNDRPLEEAGPTEQDVPVLLIDARGPLDGADLREKLSELGELVAEGKEGLKIAPSFLRWFISSLRTKDGYRIREFHDCDDGYCAVQPFFDGVETWSSKGRLLLTRGLLRGELTPTRKLIDSIYTCTACGQCYDQVSLTGLEVNNAIIQARNEIVRRGARPKPCRVLMKNILEHGNPLGMPSEDRSLWLEEFIDEFSFDCNDVLYWAGCSPSYRLPDVVESTVNVLKETEVDFGLLGDREGCCGLILYLVGLWDEAREKALQTSKMIGESGARVLVTGCAGCYYAFTRVYPEHFNIKLPLQVCHTSQLFESLINDGRLRLRRVKIKATWHDPCDLGRHCAVYEAPRNVLKAIPGLELEEMPLNREHARCCGAGGGLWLYDTDLAEKVAHSKLNEEILPMDIEGVVTGCPACTMNLRYASRTLGLELTIYDLAELVSQSL